MVKPLRGGHKTSLVENMSGAIVIYTGDRSTRKVGKKQYHELFVPVGVIFRAKNGDYFRERSPLGRVTHPTTLDHCPHTIREFRMIWSIRPAAI